MTFLTARLSPSSASTRPGPSGTGPERAGEGRWGARRVAVTEAPPELLQAQARARASKAENSNVDAGSCPADRKAAAVKAGPGTPSFHASRGRTGVPPYQPRERPLTDGKHFLATLRMEPKADVVLAGLTMHKRSTGLRNVVGKLDAYHGNLTLVNGRRNPAPHAESLRRAVIELEAALEDYGRKHAHRHKEPMKELLAQVHKERRAVESLCGMLDTLPRDGTFPAQHMLELLRDGVAPEHIIHGIAASRSATQIFVASACERARVCVGVLTENTPFTEAAHVPDRRAELGSGAVNTVWRADFRIGGKTVPMVFKPENPGGDIGIAAKAAGIEAQSPNFAGRARATYLCSQALGLSLVPPTDVTILHGQVGSVMGLVNGCQPISIGSVRIELPPKLAEGLRTRPDALTAYALQCGCTAASIAGNVLQLERRVQVPVFHEEGLPRTGPAGHPLTQPRDLPIRIALPVDSGTFRRDMVSAQWLDCFTRQVDRTSMNFMLVPRQDGGFDLRLIDNDASFGTNIRATDKIEPKTTKATHRTNLPLRIDRSQFDAFMSLDVVDALARALHGPLDDASVEITRKDALAFKEILKEYEGRGWVLETDAQWASPEVAAALGIDHDGSRLRDALKATPSERWRQRNAAAKLQQRADVTSYVAREAMEQGILQWERGVLKTAPQELLGLPALFDLAELQTLARGDTGAVETKARRGPDGAQRMEG
ncbi:hypothetical protein [Ramlibacter rhizophilus]|uniref:Uncharacterized protein n=1 Tax=Ramlibacter rhizophilus TaxID=1781167 RepID=A0A4Z0BZ33_9BURK|nr:hypothetical protein [Ramlibacter rhizophilus]TFZ04617.1 hypothetical protein EZ242_02385 [Ramlibacter rhizophilus]